MSIAQNSRFIVSVFTVSFALLFAASFLFANAQEEAAVPAQTDDRGIIILTDKTPAEETARLEAEATTLVDLDQNITAADLGVGEPTILPGNPLYAFKNFGRGFQSLFTFDPGAKVELKLKFANEKIIEAKKLEEGGASDERVKSAIENYTKETERVKVRIENLKDSGKTKEEIELIVKKTADSQIRHHGALGKMMQKRDEIAPDVEISKAAAMKHFSESMATVVEPEVLQQKFEEVLKEQKGSAFRHFKHVEVLEEVKDFVPERAKDAIQNAIVQSSKLFEEEFQNAEEGQRAIFNKYIERIGGNEVRHLEAFDAINSFADIDKAMLEEMGKAREKTRTRVGERMKGIKDETRKKVFVAHLEDAKMEDLRIVKELENNLAPETVSAVLDIKHKMEQKMREKFESAQTQGDLGSFFKEIEDAPDVRMMEVMKEMEQIIPPDKKEFFEEMKKKAVTEMQKGFDEARRFGRLEAQFTQVAGFDPEHAAVLDEFQGEFGPQFDFFQDIKKEQAERMRERFEHFREFSEERPEDTAFLEEAEAFRLRIQQDPTAQANIQQFAPQIAQDFQKFDAERGKHDFETKDVTSKIENAQIAVQQLASLLENASADTPGIEAAQSLLANARKHLENAQGAAGAEESGAAFGQAVSAFQNATNGVRKLEKSGFHEERQKYFEKRDEFREQFKGVPASERPTFEAGVPIKPPSFEDFKFERFRGAPAAGVAPDEGLFCAQVITPARHAGTGSCRTFPNSCLPPGWVPDSACETKGEVHKVIPQFEIPQEERQRFFELEQKHLEEFKKHEGDRKFKKEESKREDRVEKREELEVIPIGRSPLEEEALRKFQEQQKTAPTPAPSTTGEHPIEQKFFEKIISPLPISPLPIEKIAPTPVPAPSTSELPGQSITPLPIDQQKIIQQPATETHTITPISPTPTPSTSEGSAPTSGFSSGGGSGFSH